MPVVNDKQVIEAPVPALNLLVEILAQMGHGNAVSIVPIHAEFTTQQAADFLNVSRSFLVKLIDNGDLVRRLVGTHRRVLFKELLVYQEKSRVARKHALDELAAEAQELNLCC
jgi:excisionase family DNA binding protein